MTVTEYRAKYTDAEIKAMGAKGQAFRNPDGHYSYPIGDVDDLSNAIHAVGRGGADHDAIRRYVIGRAKAMGKSGMIPDKWNPDGSLKGSAAAGRDPAWEQRRRRWAGSLIGRRERRGMRIEPGCIELRAKPDGTGGTKYEFRGYASTFDTWFGMWDQWGDEYDESIAPGGFTETLAGVFGGPDTRFFVGHNEAGLALARTAHGRWPGTMRLAQDSTGLEVSAPDLDGRNGEVRNLASAMERGDVDAMSVGFIARKQEWSPDWSQRRLLSLDLHNGDVSVVSIPANPATAGASMVAFPAESLARAARAAGVADIAGPAGQGDEEPDTSTSSDYNPPQSHAPMTGSHTHDHAAYGAPDGDAHGHQHHHGVDGTPDASHDHGHLYSEDGTIVLDDSGVVEEVGGAMADADLLAMRLRLLELA